MIVRIVAIVGFSIIFSCPFKAQAQSYQSLGSNSNYVVIGAFAVHRNAVKFTSYAKKQKYNARYEMNQNRNLYYVYVLKTDNLNAAVSEAIRLREQSEFYDAWVYKGSFRLENGHPEGQINAPIIASREPVTFAVQTPIVETPSSETVAEQQPVVEEKKEEPAPVDEETDGKSFLFELVRANDSRVVEGDVDIVDTDRSRKMGSYKANMPVRVSSPNSKSGKISIICQVFGYRKMQKDLDYSNPDGEDIQRDENNNIVIPFELVRLQKGDISVMYNVFFYKDAGIMRPESKFEVNSLLEMMQENPNYKIRIHGHTNGNAPGKIISLPKGGNDFFSLTGTKEGFGSAKQLAQERAHCIVEFLASNGVDPKRMQIKAWGGKRPIHDKNSSHAHENVRVEVEILSH